MMVRKIAVTGASGFIGRAVVEALHKQGHDITALTRAPERTRFANDVRTARFEPNDATPQPEAFEGQDAIIHLAGESVAGRWSPEKKRAIRDSRVIGTRTLVA